MIEYHNDYEGIHTESVMHLLRSHNAQYWTADDTKGVTLYACKDGALLGAMRLNYFWDWASIAALYYQDRDVLRALAREAWQHYAESVVGIKFFTFTASRYADVLAAGFTDQGSIRYPDQTQTFYADLDKEAERPVNRYEMICSHTPVEPYETAFESKINQFKMEHGITGKIAAFNRVALDGGQVVGGITCERYETSLYVSRLAVDKKYRRKAIGSTLMQSAIDYAQANNLAYIELGTTDFQGQAFYETLGFKVKHVRKDNPRGYASYTMIKTL